MAIEGNFEIKVGGRPRDMENIRKFIYEMAKRVSRIDYNFELEETSFANLNVRYIWSGIPTKFIYFDEVWVFIRKEAYKYLTKCWFSMTADFVEKE